MRELETTSDNNLNSNDDTELKRLELWLNFWTRSIALISAFGAILGATLGYFTNERIQDVKEVESFERFLVYAVEGNVSDRIRLSELYKTLLSNKGWRDRWQAYHIESVKLQDDYYVIVDRLNDLQDSLNNENISRAKKEELQREQKLLTRKKQRLEKLVNEVEVIRTTTIPRATTNILPSTELSSYKIGIHFLETNNDLKSEAQVVREILLARGISENNIEIRGLSQSWFNSTGGLSSSQIRFEENSEYKVASELQFILQADYPEKTFNLQTIRGSSERYISIFIK